MRISAQAAYLLILDLVGSRCSGLIRRAAWTPTHGGRIFKVSAAREPSGSSWNRAISEGGSSSSACSSADKATRATESGILVDQLKSLARREASTDPDASPMLQNLILNFETFDQMLKFLFATELETPFLGAMELSSVMAEMFDDDGALLDVIASDLVSHEANEPSMDLLSTFLHHKGFHALFAYRFSHWLWDRNQTQLARYIQSVNSEKNAADIHPNARIGGSAFVSYGCDVVIGETAVIGNNVKIYHGVTLGGTGKERGDRHPKISDGVVLGTGSCVLGNIVVGEGAVVECGSVVLKPVAPYTVNGGIPSKLLAKVERSNCQ